MVISAEAAHSDWLMELSIICGRSQGYPARGCVCVCSGSCSVFNPAKRNERKFTRFEEILLNSGEVF